MPSNPNEQKKAAHLAALHGGPDEAARRHEGQHQAQAAHNGPGLPPAQEGEPHARVCAQRWGTAAVAAAAAALARSGPSRRSGWLVVQAGWGLALDRPGCHPCTPPSTLCSCQRSHAVCRVLQAAAAAGVGQARCRLVRDATTAKARCLDAGWQLQGRHVVPSPAQATQHVLTGDGSKPALLRPRTCMPWCQHTG